MDPRFRELLDELDGALTAIADGFRALMESPLNRERAGATVDAIDTARDVVREMKDQEQEVTE